MMMDRTPESPGTDMFDELLAECGRGELLATQLRELSSDISKQASSGWKRPLTD
jgi:hypothetical protein